VRVVVLGGSVGVSQTDLTDDRLLVQDLYDVLRHAPYRLLAGDFIRAECRAEKGASRVLRKEERLTADTAIVRVMTNKKAVWQRGTRRDPFLAS